jgi:hypothetical protein
VLKNAVPAKGHRDVLTPEVMKIFCAVKRVYFVKSLNIATVGESTANPHFTDV